MPYLNNNQTSYNTPITITPEESAAGINPDLKMAARRFLCPTCGKEFSLFQSRAIACKACKQANQNCPNVRCPHCDNEFPIKGFVVQSKQESKRLNDYADGVFTNWDNAYGFNRR
jgi:hypothetical protein